MVGILDRGLLSHNYAIVILTIGRRLRPLLDRRKTSRLKPGLSQYLSSLQFFSLFNFFFFSFVLVPFKRRSQRSVCVCSLPCNHAAASCCPSSLVNHIWLQFTIIWIVYRAGSKIFLSAHLASVLCLWVSFVFSNNFFSSKPINDFNFFFAQYLGSR